MDDDLEISPSSVSEGGGEFARWTLGVDVGGTFTDFFAWEETGNLRHLAKRLSTPGDPGRAVVEGVEQLLSAESIRARQVQRFAHGTTVATNALIQRRGAKVALITTRGFRDLLEIGRQTRPHMYDLNRDRPPPLVPRARRFEVTERITADGAVLKPVDDEELAKVIAAVEESGAEACAVCFLFAYLNPAHEEMVAARLRDAMPGLRVSLSSAVQPEFREYERFSTTVTNAYLQPLVGRYIGRLEEDLKERLPRARLGINQSSGGLMSPARAAAFPVRTALSGPAAGVVGAQQVAARAGRRNVITLDVGGTSADMALIREGSAALAFEREVAEFPIRLPMVEVHTIGAGGGSIAWFDRDGLMKVGPQSAGADPGPACYGQGGESATISDANLVLGRLSPALIDGSLSLREDLACDAIRPFAESLGFSIERTAQGMVEILVANMVRAIRTLSVERGHDPRDYVLMPFGGAGPLHAREVAALLGIREILVPVAPGILCAEGLVMSDLKETFVESRRLPLVAESLVNLADAIVTLRKRAICWFSEEWVSRDGRALELSLDLRYLGQNFEITLPVLSGSDIDPQGLPALQRLQTMFYEAHEAHYGFANQEDPIEVVNLRLAALGRHLRDCGTQVDAGEPAAPLPRGRRSVVFTGETPVEAQVFARAELLPGQPLRGPAIIEQLDCTTPIYPGDLAEVDAAGNLLITLGKD